MSEWRDVTLADLGRFSSGKPIVPGLEGQFKAYGSNGVIGGSAVARHDRGIIVGRVGAYCGSVAVSHDPFWASDNTIVVEPTVDDDLDYLYYLLRFANLNRHAGGAAQPLVTQGTLKALRFPVPEPRLRVRIGQVLANFDALIANSRRRVEVLEEMARAIYREWFVKFRYPGHEDVPLVNSALGPIPQGWGTPRLREHVSTQYGYTESASTTPVGPKYLRGMDINKTSFIDWSTVPFCPIDEVAAEKFRIRIGDVFVIRMADPGKVGICEEGVDAVFASYLVRVRPLSRLLRPYYLFFTLSDSEYQGWVTGASTGATRKSVSAKVMTEPCVVLPPPALQLQFESAIDPIRAEMSTLVNKNAKLSELRDLLLPKLVTGQIDVSTLDIDGLPEGSAA